MRMREMAMKSSLKQGLASLPKPKETEWELEAPEDQMDVVVTDGLEEDSEERDRRERQIREAQEALERKRRTQVMQKELPRPDTVDIEALVKEAAAVEDPVEALIAKEAALLIANDAVKYPVPGSKVKGKPLRLAQLDDAALSDARLQIFMEFKDKPKPEEVAAVFDRENSNAILLGLGCYLDEEEEQQATAMQCAFDAVQISTMSTVEKCEKLEKKLKLHLGGYQNRAKILRQKTGEALDALEKANAALSGFETLSISEEIAAKSRLDALRDEVAYVSRREREAQEVYRQTKEELEVLGAGVNGHQ
jgi:pre-mRNA-splicing factor CDC5/CEF1